MNNAHVAGLDNNMLHKNFSIRSLIKISLGITVDF